jgi:predicted acylesterase/phospholipase RssA
MAANPESAGATGAGGGARSAGSEALPPCDLVMKGGITSGVVYPKLISTLAGKYRFKSIGGTSAGAIAAAGCAAAEHYRQNATDPRQSLRSFTRLEALPGELQKPVGGGKTSMLFNLFQPTPALRSHFNVLAGALNAPDGVARLLRAIAALVLQFPFWACLGLAIGVLLLAPVVSAVTSLVWWRAGAWALAIAIGWVIWALAVGRLRLWKPAWLPLTRLLVLLALGGFVWSAKMLWWLGAPLTWLLAAVAAVATIAMLIGLALAVALPAWRFVATLLAGVHANYYGLCSGRTVAGDTGAQGLTDWLYGYFNELAGIGDRTQPLCFGHLWGKAPDLKNVVAHEPDTPPADRVVNLEVMTTAVSQQLCYSLPFRDNAAPFYYDEEQWRELFPDEVVDWLVAADAAEQAAVERAAGERFDPNLRVQYCNAAGKVLRRLPSNRYLPVVVAVRMSLSFPVLLAAIPLYSVDRSLTENIDEAKRQQQHEQQDRAARGNGKFVYLATRVWFSDGGISSNMPLHFFDSPLPGHPTFAVNLKEPHPRFPIDRTKKAKDQEGRVYLPTGNVQGLQRYWKEPDDAAPLGLYRFLTGIVATMQNWRDEIQFPYPGYRDRIVQVSQLPDEGGLNLNMPERNIEALSDAGGYAAEKLIARFHPTSAAPEKGGWENHQEVRARTFLGVLERMALSLHKRIAGGTWNAVVERVRGRAYSSKEADLALDCLRRVADLGQAITDSGQSVEQEAPRPRATMRIAPRI